jgi:signal transduction histidine kinase
VPLLRAGPPWEAIHFAAPLEASEGVVAARLPAATPRALVLILLLADVAVFTAFGGYLLRRRVVLPLQRVAAAARAVGAGELEVRAPVEGVGETALVASTFNEMTEALARRSRDLEKAVSDLRESNRSLREARVGLDRAERLAAVGRLAAGVAHEVGNPMGAMLAFVDLAGRDPGLSEAGREYLLRAGREGERVRKILGQLLDFSRPLHGSRVPVAMPALCEETAALVRAQSRYARIAIEVVAEGSPPPVLADPGGVKQILLNLLLNAADALADRDGERRIRVRVRGGAQRVRAGEDRGTAGPRRHLDAVECIVEDNGPGIAAEDRERIFDPFFSTKTPGEGTGLGLSNALRLAEEFGGSLELDASAGGPGATFALRLPVAAAGAEAGEPRERG